MSKDQRNDEPQGQISTRVVSTHKGIVVVAFAITQVSSVEQEVQVSAVLVKSDGSVARVKIEEAN